MLGTSKIGCGKCMFQILPCPSKDCAVAHTPGIQMLLPVSCQRPDFEEQPMSLEVTKTGEMGVGSTQWIW